VDRLRDELADTNILLVPQWQQGMVMRRAVLSAHSAWHDPETAQVDCRKSLCADARAVEQAASASVVDTITNQQLDAHYLTARPGVTDKAASEPEHCEGCLDSNPAMDPGIGCPGIRRGGGANG
jgi:hypothetical protein